jgi:hypothetical protein
MRHRDGAPGPNECCPPIDTGDAVTRSTFRRAVSVVAAGCLAATLLPGTATAAADRSATVTVTPDRAAPGSTISVSGACQHEWPAGPEVGASVHVHREWDDSRAGKSSRSTSTQTLLDAGRRFDVQMEVPEDFIPDRYSVGVLCYGGDAIYASAATELVVTGRDRRPSFVDVPRSYLHHEAIRELAAAGVVEGCGDGRFCPTDAVTRAQFASLLARQLGLAEQETDFVDVAAGSTHAGAIGALQTAGFVVGCTVDRFCPGRPLRRDEAATLLARADDRLARPIEPGSHEGFVDVPTSSAHWPAVHVLASVDDVRGCSEVRFCPARSSTRAQAARLLHRVFGYGY